MKPLHPAALALIAWYLISPPLRADATGHVAGIDLAAPLSEWFSWKTLSSEEACEAEKKPLQAYAKQFHSRSDPVYRYSADAMDAAKCVSSDHPPFKFAKGHH
jgi:hypothetical protein